MAGRARDACGSEDDKAAKQGYKKWLWILAVQLGSWSGCASGAQAA